MSDELINPFDTDRSVEIYARKEHLFAEEKYIFNEYLADNKYMILDLGCGTGRTTRHLTDMGHNVVGVDIAPNMIKEAKRLHPDIPFVYGDAKNLITHSDESYDVVLFSFNGLDYLYPIKNRLLALSEIRRVLKPGGLFIYSSHKLEALLSYRAFRRIKLHSYPYFKERTVYGYLILYYGTEKDNLHQLDQVGFTVLSTEDHNQHSWRYYVCQKN